VLQTANIPNRLRVKNGLILSFKNFMSFFNGSAAMGINLEKYFINW
jgi:hypothetical protein